eukprot:10412178-Heterocapsa_arctica.AAC.1
MATMIPPASGKPSRASTTSGRGSIRHIMPMRRAMRTTSCPTPSRSNPARSRARTTTTPVRTRSG